MAFQDSMSSGVEEEESDRFIDGALNLEGTKPLMCGKTFNSLTNPKK